MGNFGRPERTPRATHVSVLQRVLGCLHLLGLGNGRWAFVAALPFLLRLMTAVLGRSVVTVASVLTDSIQQNTLGTLEILLIFCSSAK